MNPEVIRAARALIKYKQQHPDMTPDQADFIARDHGVDPQHIAEYIAKLRADGGNLVASGLEGFTANFGDELVGLLPNAVGGGESGKEEMRLRRELAHMDHPVASTAAEFAGGAASAVVAGGAFPNAVRGASALANVGRAAVTGAEAGAAFGAASGIGAGETSEERSQGGAVGAVTGALFGGALGAAGRAVGELTPSAAVLRKHLEAIEKSSGFQALRAKLAEFTAAGKSGTVVAADLSPYMEYNAAQAIRRSRPLDAIEAKEELGARQKVVERTDRAWRDKAYGAIKAQNIEFTPEEISSFVHKPTIAAALEKARVAGNIKAGDELDQLMRRVASGGKDPKDMKALETVVNLPEELRADALRAMNLGDRPVTFSDLNLLQRELDTRIGHALSKDKRNVDLAEAYREVRQQVLDAIEAKIPAFKEVQAAASERYKTAGAMSDTQKTIASVAPAPESNPISSIAHSVIYGPKYAAWNIIGKMFGHPHGTRVANKMRADLLTQGAGEVEHLLQRLEEPLTWFHAGRAGALGGRAAPAVHSLFRGR